MSTEHNLTVISGVNTNRAKASSCDIHVHLAGCADIRRDPGYRHSSKYTDPFGSLEEVASSMYDPGDFDWDPSDDDALNGYLSEFYFAPCVPEMPLRATDAVESTNQQTTNNERNGNMPSKTATKKSTTSSIPKERVKRETTKLQGKAAPVAKATTPKSTPKAKATPKADAAETATKKAAREARATEARQAREAQHAADAAEVIRLRDEHGMKWHEIAAQMGRHQNYVQQRYLDVKLPAREFTPEAVRAARDEELLGWAQIESAFKMPRGQLKKAYVDAGGDLKTSYVGRGGKFHADVDRELVLAKFPKPERPAKSSNGKVGRPRKLKLTDESTEEEVRAAIEGKTITRQLSEKMGGGTDEITVKSVTKVAKAKGSGVLAVAFTDEKGKSRTVQVGSILKAR